MGSTKYSLTLFRRENQNELNNNVTRANLNMMSNFIKIAQLTVALGQKCPAQASKNRLTSPYPQLNVQSTLRGEKVNMSTASNLQPLPVIFAIFI